MSVPVGRSGNVDGEGRTEDGLVHTESLSHTGGMVYVPQDYRMRVRVVETGIQPQRSLRWTRTTILIGVDESGRRVFTTTLESEPWLEELPDHADDYGADGS
jgi:hypothetical protein